MSALARFWSGDERENGQANVLLVIILLAMLMMIGLAIDAGQIFVARRSMQEAADAGAYAGAVVLYESGTGAQAVAAALVDVTMNGYTNGGQAGLVTVNAYSPPTLGVYTGNLQFVEVIITQQVRTALVPAQSTLTNVTVRGVGGAAAVPVNYSIVTLDRTNQDTLNWGSSGALTVSGAGIFVDSSASHAASHGGSGAITYSGGSYPTQVVGQTSGTWPAGLLTGQTAIADPYAGTPKPSTVGLPTFTSLPADPLDPGVYDGVNINAPRTLHPGVYILKNSSIHDAVSGTGVLIWIASSNFPGNGSTCGEIKVDGGLVQLTAQTTGPYQGLAIVQEVACTSPIKLRAAVNFDITGTVYAPGAALDLSSNGTTASMSQLVVKSVDASSSATLTVTYTVGTTGHGTGLVPALSE